MFGFGNQSDTAEDADRLGDLAAAVANDTWLPDHIRLAAGCVVEQAAAEAEEYRR